MRQAIKGEGQFATAYNDLKAQVDEQIKQPITVPVPKDGGGGYTHERHKKELSGNVQRGDYLSIKRRR